ncbi:hypothetical protein ACQU0X_22305 [Pseudovibrio ascidiaceicola]|uniref:hypothetical protein n=1 Tax=Pseudovibrio ascidiaceicola TaxID=285279 RepID=UPI003D36E14A
MPEDNIADQNPSFRAHTDITSDELVSGLHSLELIRGDIHLSLQVSNLTVVDQFIMSIEHQTLHDFVETEGTPTIAMFLNAQSQMWIFAAYELLRTWRALAKETIKLAENGGLELKADSLEKDQGFLNGSREMQAIQLRKIAADMSIIETIKTDLRRTHIPFSRIEHLRVSLAKNEIRGKRNSVAYTPGYGRISMVTGSLEYQLENGHFILGTISRREIADELRALNNPNSAPTEDEVASFDEYMKASIPKEELEAFRENPRNT